MTKTSDNNQNLFITITSAEPNGIKIDDIIRIVNLNCSVVNLRRLDETKDAIEVSFMVEFENITNLEKIKNDIKKLDKSVSFNFIDNKGIY